MRQPGDQRPPKCPLLGYLGETTLGIRLVNRKEIEEAEVEAVAKANAAVVIVKPTELEDAEVEAVAKENAAVGLHVRSSKMPKSKQPPKKVQQHSQ